MNKFFRFIGAVLSTFAIIFGLGLITDTYVAGVIKVDDMTIEGLLESNDIIMIDKITQNFKTLSRFDFLVFKHPETGELTIQRIIGLPSEKVDYLQGQLYINTTQMDEPFLSKDTPGAVKTQFSAARILPDTAGNLPEKHYIVINDDRSNDDDSRKFGAISQDDIIGVIKMRLFPFQRFEML